MTRDVVFLFQVGDWVATGNAPRNCEWDDEDGWVATADNAYYDAGHVLTNQELEDEECVVQRWRTIGVWLDRDEAEAWGEGQRHNFGEKHKDWRAYGIPAEGVLAELLRQAPAVVRELPAEAWETDGGAVLAEEVTRVV